MERQGNQRSQQALHMLPPVWSAWKVHDKCRKIERCLGRSRGDRTRVQTHSVHTAHCPDCFVIRGCDPKPHELISALGEHWASHTGMKTGFDAYQDSHAPSSRTTQPSGGFHACSSPTSSPPAEAARDSSAQNTKPAVVDAGQCPAVIFLG